MSFVRNGRLFRVQEAQNLFDKFYENYNIPVFPLRKFLFNLANMFFILFHEVFRDI